MHFALFRSPKSQDSSNRRGTIPPSVPNPSDFNSVKWGWSYFVTISFCNFVKYVKTESFNFRDFLYKYIKSHIYTFTMT